MDSRSTAESGGVAEVFAFFRKRDPTGQKVIRVRRGQGKQEHTTAGQGQ